ncbi:sure-like protein [Dacryopinax primogenitus]|uniref:Sure-like protein n=1 Tax=Dacryopinax primogenitus (strain DJM 731) TaxID=1858805 RepID=M5FUB2_DACPD|nr:sure-like protein [Dacryopinax primogenitus]EJT99793.1 sure-like protein [Dacryopinax primogenitus]
MVRVILTNDDGPPNPKESPYVFSFARALEKELGWEVKVVLPASQKSWIDGMGEYSDISRPLKDGEVAEWILLEATPATCANIALHNLFPGEIDLVISGPNFGRNSSACFMLSSGTIGATLSASLSHVRSIALSYATFHHPTPLSFTPPANSLSCRIIKSLYSNWGTDESGLRQGEVDLYSINVPMIETLLAEGSIEALWTTAWRNGYGRLFKPSQKPTTLKAAGPDAPSSSESSSRSITPANQPSHSLPKFETDAETAAHPLTFHFAPDMEPLVRPDVATLPEGTDTWALHRGFASVTPLRAAFAEPGAEGLCLAGEVEGRPGAKVRIRASKQEEFRVPWSKCRRTQRTFRLDLAFLPLGVTSSTLAILPFIKKRIPSTPLSGENMSTPLSTSHARVAAAAAPLLPLGRWESTPSQGVFASWPASSVTIHFKSSYLALEAGPETARKGRPWGSEPMIAWCITSPGEAEKPENMKTLRNVKPGEVIPLFEGESGVERVCRLYITDWGSVIEVAAFLCDSVDSLLPIPKGTEPTTRLLVIGDSISCAYSMGPDAGLPVPPHGAWDGYSLILERLLRAEGKHVGVETIAYPGVTLVDTYMAGWQQDGMVTKFWQESWNPSANPLYRPPTVIIIALGANDDGRDVPIFHFALNMSEFIKKLVSTFSASLTDVVILGPFYGVRRSGGSRFGPAMDALVKELRAEWENEEDKPKVHHVPTTDWLTPDVVPDGIHPDVEGNRILGEKLKVVEAAGWEEGTRW